MVTQNRYLLAALPGLGDLGTAPPLTGVELLEQVGESSSSRRLVEVIFLSDDLLQHQGLLAGEKMEAELTVLTPGQGRNEEPLPDYLVISDEEDSRQQVMLDHIWQSYYDYAAAVAGKHGSSFLRGWIGYEVGLRNAIATSRSKALRLDVTEYLVRPELGQAEEDFGGLLNEWAAARDPLAGLRVLDAGRWDWLNNHDGWFTFGDDEAAAYAAKLMLLRRWQRISSEK